MDGFGPVLTHQAYWHKMTIWNATNVYSLSVYEMDDSRPVLAHQAYWPKMTLWNVTNAYTINDCEMDGSGPMLTRQAPWSHIVAKHDSCAGVVLMVWGKCLVVLGICLMAF